MTPHSENPTQSPVLTLDEASTYLKRSKNALRILRHRGRGPDSFISEGRIFYYRESCDSWLKGQAVADPRFRPEPVAGPQPRIRRPATATSLKSAA